MGKEAREGNKNKTKNLSVQVLYFPPLPIVVVAEHNPNMKLVTVQQSISEGG